MKKLVFLCVLKVNDENSRIRIWIVTKISWIRNTDSKDPHHKYLFLQSLIFMPRYVQNSRSSRHPSVSILNKKSENSLFI
jgi:hypothetical protein